MSLINDALNRAQAEAAGKEALERGDVGAATHQPRLPARRRPPAWTWVAPALLVLAVVALWRWPTHGGPVEEVAKPKATAPVPDQSEAPRIVEASQAEQPPAVEAPPVATLDHEALTPSAGMAAPPAAAKPEPVEIPTAAPEPAEAVVGTATAGEKASAEMTRGEPVSAPAPVATPVAPEPTPATAVDGVIAAETAVAGEPATIWPADGAEEETWYYVGKVELPGGGAIELAGIAWSKRAPLALLNGSLLGVGDDILGLEIVAIAPRTVTLAGQGQRIALQLGPAQR